MSVSPTLFLCTIWSLTIISVGTSSSVSITFCILSKVLFAFRTKPYELYARINPASPVFSLYPFANPPVYY